MRAYGHTRYDKLECIYGCCTGKSGTQKNCRKIVDAARRKKARQEGKQGKLFTSLINELGANSETVLY